MSRMLRLPCHDTTIRRSGIRGSKNSTRTLSGFMFLWAAFMVREDWPIIWVMRFMLLLAWICATLNSAMSAIWSICWARACFDSSILAFW